MKSRLLASHPALATSFALIASTMLTACRQESGGSGPSILQVKGEAVRVRLLDASSGRPIANADVELWSDNGVRCIQPPCPTNARQWTGRSDAAGEVSIPTRLLQPVTAIKTPTHEGDLIGDSEPDESGRWVAELFARDSSGTGSNPIKLIDGRSRKPIASVLVRIEFQTDTGRWDTMSTTTTGLGYIFVPLEIVARAGDRAWVVVPGYRRTRLDFAWARHRTLLRRL